MDEVKAQPVEQAKPEPARHAIVRDGVIENVVLWDGVTEWSPPEGTTVVKEQAEGEAEIGGAFDGAKFTAAPMPEPVVAPVVEVAPAPPQ